MLKLGKLQVQESIQRLYHKAKLDHGKNILLFCMTWIGSREGPALQCLTDKTVFAERLQEACMLKVRCERSSLELHASTVNSPQTSLWGVNGGSSAPRIWNN